MNESGWRTLVIGIETTLLLSFATFWLTTAQNYVTKADLQYMAPYVRDKELIDKHMNDSVTTFTKISETLEKQNLKFDLEISALKVALARMQGGRSD